MKRDIVGYTNDGFVFMVSDSSLEGTPIKIRRDLNPEDARALADNLIKAAELAERKTNVGNSPNAN